MPDNTIRFGMSDYDGSKGFKVRNFTNFSNEIRLSDIFAEMGNNMSWDTRKTIENIFNGIAGKDGVIDKNDLIKYLKQLDNAAFEGDVSKDKDILDVNEIFGLEVKRGNLKKQDTFLGIPVNVDTKMRGALGKFVKALVDINDKNVAADKDLAARTTYHKDGSRTVKESDYLSEFSWDNQTQRSTTYDKDNKIKSKSYLDANGIRHKVLYKDGQKVKDYHEDKETKWITTFDSRGNTIKEETISKTGDFRCTEVSSYDNSGKLVKRVTTYNSGTSEESYYNNNSINNYLPAKTVFKKDGKIDRTKLYTYDKNGNNVKSVTKDAKGDIVSTIIRQFDKNGLDTKVTHDFGDNNRQTEVYTRDKEGNILKEEHFFNDKPSLTHYYDKKGNETKLISYDFPHMGQITTQAMGKNGPIKAEIKDNAGNLLETRDYTYDSKGREVKAIAKDSNGNLKATWTTTYTANDNRTEKRAADGTLLHVSTFEHNSKGEMIQGTEEYYKDGKLLCVEEEIWDDGHLTTVYKDGNNVTISIDDFRRIEK